MIFKYFHNKFLSIKSFMRQFSSVHQMLNALRAAFLGFMLSATLSALALLLLALGFVFLVSPENKLKENVELHAVNTGSYKSLDIDQFAKSITPLIPTKWSSLVFKGAIPSTAFPVKPGTSVPYILIYGSSFSSGGCELLVPVYEKYDGQRNWYEVDLEHTGMTCSSHQRLTDPLSFT